MRKYLGLLLILLVISGCGKSQLAFPVSEINPPALNGKVVIKEIKVLPVPGFKTFDPDVEKFVPKFDSYGSYDLLVRNGNYLLRVVNRKGELVLVHNGKQVYLGKEIPHYELSEDGTYVIYYFDTYSRGLYEGKLHDYSQRDYYIDGKKVGYSKSSSCVSENENEECIERIENYLNDNLVTSTPYFLSIILSSSEKPEFYKPNSLGETCANRGELIQKFEKECSMVHMVRQSTDCLHYIVITTESKIKSNNLEPVDCDQSKIFKNYWHDGQLIKSESLSPGAALGWGAISANGRQYIFNSSVDIKIGDSGAWILNNTNSSKDWKINGKLVDADSRIGDLYKVEMNDEGTAYLLSGSKGWLTNDGQFIAKNNASVAELDGNTVYHYIFESD